MRTWRFLPQIIVRTAGFPVSIVDNLRFESTVELFRQVAETEREAEALRGDELVPMIRTEVERARQRGDKSRLRRLSVLRRRLACQSPGDPAELAPVRRWNGLLASRDALLGEAREVFTAELAERRARLRQTVADERVLDALLLCSQEIRQAAERHVAAGAVPRTSAVRERERRLVTYLQRLCAKNETQSFFGPLNYGRLDGQRPLNLTIRRAPERIRLRESFPTQWMAQRLAERIAADPASRSLLLPRRGTMAHRDGELVVFPATGRTRTLAGPDLRLYLAADGRRTVAELAAMLAEPVTGTWRRVTELADARLLEAGPVLPPDLPDPLDWLITWLCRWPPHARPRRDWEPVLRSLHARIRSFAHAEAARRPDVLAAVAAEFTSACGAEASRAGGSMYADRSPLFEECLGDLEQFVVGGDLHRVITTRLAPVLDLAVGYGSAEHGVDQAAAAALIRAAAGHTVDSSTVDSLPLLRYFAMLSRNPVARQPDPALDGLLADLAATIETGDAVVRLHGSDLPGGGSDSYLVTSVDLMLSSASVADVQAGRFQLVLGEMHPQPLPWVFPSAHLLDERERTGLGAELAAAIGAQPGAACAATIAHTRSNKIFPYPLPGRVVELRPRLPVADAVPAADLRVEADGDEVRCTGPAGPLRFYPPLRRRTGELDPVAPLAFPPVHLPTIGTGPHLPRIEVDGVVVQRERWQAAPEEFGHAGGDDFELFHSVWRAAREHGLPAQVYLRVPQEPKPVFIDFDNAFLAELVAHLSRLSSELSFSEALPGTGQAWLDGFCCELRLIAIGRAEVTE